MCNPITQKPHCQPFENNSAFVPRRVQGSTNNGISSNNGNSGSDTGNSGSGSSNFSEREVVEPETNGCVLEGNYYAMGAERKIIKDSMTCICNGYNNWDCQKGCEMNGKLYQPGEQAVKQLKQKFKDVVEKKPKKVRVCLCKPNLRWKCEKDVKEVDEVMTTIAPPVTTSSLESSKPPVKHDLSASGRRPFPGSLCFGGTGLHESCQCPEGLIGDGYDCRAKSCLDSPCYKGAECSDTYENGVIGYKCFGCPEENGVKLVGDGITCVKPGTDCVMTELGLVCDDDDPPCVPVDPETILWDGSHYEEEECFAKSSSENEGSGNIVETRIITEHQSKREMIEVEISDFKFGCAELNPCYPDVECIDNDSGWLCGECPEYMLGNGIAGNCTHIDCDNSTPCIEQSVCTNLDQINEFGQKYKCDCPEGWQGKGQLRQNAYKSLGWGNGICLDNRKWCETEAPCPKDTFCNEDEVYGAFCTPCEKFHESPGGGVLNCTDTRIWCSSSDRPLCGSHEKCVDHHINGYRCVMKSCKDKPCYENALCIDLDRNQDSVSKNAENVDRDFITGFSRGFVCKCSQGWVYDVFTNKCVDERVWCGDFPCPKDHSCEDDKKEGAVCSPCPPYHHSHQGLECIDERIWCNSTTSDGNNGGRPCHPLASCRDMSFGAWCGSCPFGFSGNGKFCVDERKNCEDEPCFEGVGCTNLPSATGMVAYECGKCPEFFEGDGVSCEDTRISCSEKTCFEGVTCEETFKGGVCGDCPIGWVGNGENTMHGCIDPRIHCDDMECFKSCKETVDGGVCDKCPQYFTGDGANCIDMRTHCDENPCFPAAKCIELETGALCGACPTYFTGDGVNCTDTRTHCEDINCWGELACYEEEDGAVCAQCPLGFIGDGLACNDTRPHCDTLNCFEPEHCREDNLLGGLCAPCPYHFSGDGINCSDNRVYCESLLENKINPCFEGVECINTDSGHTCGDCPEHYQGDGFNCYDTRTYCTKMGDSDGFSGNFTDLYGNFIDSSNHNVSEGYQLHDLPQIPCIHPNATCVDTDEGAVCKCDFLPGFVTSGYMCIDTRTHCDKLDCFTECEESDAGAVCRPCHGLSKW